MVVGRKARRGNARHLAFDPHPWSGQRIADDRMTVAMAVVAVTLDDDYLVGSPAERHHLEGAISARSKPHVLLAQSVPERRGPV